MAKLITITLFTYLIWPICLPAQNSDSVLSRYFRAIGGYNKWQSVTTLYKNAKSTPVNGPLVFAKVYAKSPYAIREERQGINKSSIYVYSSQVTWFKRDKEAAIKAYDAANKQENARDSIMAAFTKKESDEKSTFRDYPFWIFYAIKRGDSISYVGKKSFRGSEYEVIETIQYKENYSLANNTSKGAKKKYFKNVLYFDPETFLLVYDVHSSKGLSIPLSNGVRHYLDYRNVDGYVLPFTREDYREDNTLEGTYEILEIKINQPIDDSLFAFPSEK